MKQDKLKATARLLEIMDTLREQCPWDRKQTFETLRNNTIEETYELADAILNKDLDGIKEEAGDLLLHVVFYAKLGEEAGRMKAVLTPEQYAQWIECRECPARKVDCAGPACRKGDANPGHHRRPCNGAPCVDKK